MHQAVEATATGYYIDLFFSPTGESRNYNAADGSFKNVVPFRTLGSDGGIVRKVTPSGHITTLAHVWEPGLDPIPSIAVNSQDQVFVAEKGAGVGYVPLMSSDLRVDAAALEELGDGPGQVLGIVAGHGCGPEVVAADHHVTVHFHVPPVVVIASAAKQSLLPEPGGLYAKVFPFSLRPQAHDIIRTWAFYTILQS